MSKKKWLIVAILGVVLVFALIFLRYNYRKVLFYLQADAVLEADEVRLPILIYHDFSEEEINQNPLIVGRENFRRQMKYLKENGFHAVSPEQIVDFVENGVPLPKNPVWITIDDGYESNYKIAYEVLKEFDTKATIFMIGHAVGTNTYKETGAPMPSYLTLEQGKEMIASGLVSIQSHSMDMHQVEDYEKYRNNKEIRTSAVRKDFDTVESYISYFTKDTEQSKKQITQEFHEKWLAYSYPLGHYDELSERLLAESGIKATVTVEHGVNILKIHSPDSLRMLKRMNMTDKTTNDDLWYLLRTRVKK